MENILEVRMKRFLAVSFGYGDGDSAGCGYSDCDGYGCGEKDGDKYGVGCSVLGFGDGYGDGKGHGNGNAIGCGTLYGNGYGKLSSSSVLCDGISVFNGRKVYMIDGIPTLIDTVHGNYALGHILDADFTLTPCCIAKVEDSFAHGDTLDKAFHDARAKAFERMPLDERITQFRQHYPDPDKPIRASELYDWHHYITGSCEMGRKKFAENHGINIYKDSFTVRQFITLTSHTYGSSDIMKLAKAYGIDI